MPRKKPEPPKARPSVEVLIAEMRDNPAPAASLLSESRKALAERERHSPDDPLTKTLRALFDERLAAALDAEGRKNASLLNTARLAEQDQRSRLPEAQWTQQDTRDAIERALEASNTTSLPFMGEDSPTKQ
jgi:hypothetical protein